MSTCGICFNDAPAGQDRCMDCAEWEAYFFNLTPEQQEHELHAMDEYVIEQANRRHAERRKKP